MRHGFIVPHSKERCHDDGQTTPATHGNTPGKLRPRRASKSTSWQSRARRNCVHAVRHRALGKPRYILTDSRAHLWRQYKPASQARACATNRMNAETRDSLIHYCTSPRHFRFYGFYFKPYSQYERARTLSFTGKGSVALIVKPISFLAIKPAIFGSVSA